MKRVVIALLAMTFAILPAQQAFAHVLGEDESGKRGALLHIMPDDNPVAGQDTTIYFDLQGFENETINKVTLDVMDRDIVLTTLPLGLNGTTVSADYTFRAAGTYELNLKVQTNDDLDTFSFTQQVSDDETNPIAQIMTHWWAVLLLVVASSGIGALVVLFIMRRKDIAKRSVGL